MFTIIAYKKDEFLKIKNEVTDCILSLKCNNLFKVEDHINADIVLFNTDIPASEMIRLGQHFAKLKTGCKIISYNNFASSQKLFPYFTQLETNQADDDRFTTSWSKKGWKFYIWEKIEFPNWEEYYNEYNLALEKERVEKEKQDEINKKLVEDKRKKRQQMRQQMLQDPESFLSDGCAYYDAYDDDWYWEDNDPNTYHNNFSACDY